MDTSIWGIYRSKTDAEAARRDAEREARAKGYRVLDDDEDRDWDESEWQVYYKVEAHTLD